MESELSIGFTKKRPEKSLSKNIGRRTILACVTAFMVFSLFNLAFAGSRPHGWRQVNRDGFLSGLGPNDVTRLFTFDGKLYALNGNGFFRMNNPLTRNWSRVYPPRPPDGPGTGPSQLMVLGDYLYAAYNDSLWLLEEGNDPDGGNWHKLFGVYDKFMLKTIFDGKIYGVRSTSQGFEIWRAPAGVYDKTLRETWERVVENSFGDPQNNTSVDVMTVFDDRIYAGVGTLTANASFGDVRAYGTGVEIWESASGDLHSWGQVNVDGFGTKFDGCVVIQVQPPKKVCNFAIHQDIGSAVVYRAGGRGKPYLYIGTLSHYGAEIWRYNGTGVNGWENVTPPWAGPQTFYASPGRNEDMDVFHGELYLAEGYPTANLARYDGTDWSVVVAGPEFPGCPHTFADYVIRLSSLAVYDGRIYVSDGSSLVGTHGDQVWGYYFNALICPEYLPLLLH